MSIVRPALTLPVRDLTKKTIRRPLCAVNRFVRQALGFDMLPYVRFAWNACVFSGSPNVATAERLGVA